MRRAVLDFGQAPGPARREDCEPVTGTTYPDWDAVYRDNVTWVYRLMYSKVGNQPDAEDLTAEVFMTALSRCGSRRRCLRCAST